MRPRYGAGNTQPIGSRRNGRISGVRWCSTRTGSNFYSWLSKNGAANLLVQSDVDLKSGTLPNKTFDTDLRTMRFRNPPRDRKAKPGSGLPGARLVRAVETLENNGQIFLRYADASILNLSDGIVPVSVKTNENAPAGRRVCH